MCIRDRVFTLQNENGTLTLCHVGSSGDSMYGSFIGDPGHFLLYDRIDLLGTYMAYRSFHMGEDGMPEADGTVYTCLLYTSPWVPVREPLLSELLPFL